MQSERAPRPLPADPLDIRLPSVRTLPLVFSSPHSGRDYPPEFVAASRLDPLALRRSEDSFVEEIFAAAPALGAPLIAARFPRAYLDVNREPWELDPAMFSEALPAFVNATSPRVRMGLGTIARIVASGEEIYANRLSFAEATARVEAFYRPYHRSLARLVETTQAAFGGCLLVDCHSMPSAGSGRSGDGIDVVLGDCHGTACSREVVNRARRFLERRGFAVALNAPYAGGFTTDHYGRPRQGRHALQIELNRALYMEERNYRRKPCLTRIAEEMARFIEELGRIARDCIAPAEADPRRVAAD